MNWILILVFLADKGSYKGVSISVSSQTIDGFTSMERCSSAGNQIAKDRSGYIVTYSCVRK
jgi:hypothetical protein